MKSKIVKRTWVTKTGQIKSKVYDYSKQYENVEYKPRKKTIRTRYIITKTGKINKTAMRELLANNPQEMEDIERRIRLEQDLGKKGVSVQRFMASYNHDRIMGMFANAGVSIEEAAIQANTTVDALLEKNNWNNDVFTAPNGKTYRFVFNYNDAVFEEIKQ